MKNEEMFPRLVKLIHSIKCRKRHAQEMEVLFERLKGKEVLECCFYLEDSLAEYESQPDHKVWIQEALALMEHLKTDDPLSALDAIYKALEIVQQTTRLLSDHPNARFLVLELLQQTEDLQASQVDR